MKKLLVSFMAVAALVGVALAETDYKALPIIQDIQKGVNNANQIQDLRVQDDATIGDDADVVGDLTAGTITSDAGVTATTSVDAGSEVSSYGYNAVVSSNITSQVYMFQSGTLAANVGVTSTQAFPVVYIATPQVLYQYSAGAGVYVPTNVISVATNQFVLLAETNFVWTSYGRVK